jgi:uncharacterized protein (TIGR02757 family)
MKPALVEKRRGEVEALYARFHRREYVDLDPLGLLYRYDRFEDREVAGIFAAGLAFGNVKAIVADAGRLLGAMGRSPADFVGAAAPAQRARAAAKGIHRWTTADEILAVFDALRAMRGEWGTLRACFEAKLDPADETVLNALRLWHDDLARHLPSRRNSLLPDPRKSSAGKRLHLYLRWMVRQDAIDPGGWAGVPPAKLIVPLDVHMHRIGRRLGFTRRKQANLAAALEVTAALRVLDPADPVRFDFSLTRWGMSDSARTRRVRAESELRAFSANGPRHRNAERR